MASSSLRLMKNKKSGQRYVLYKGKRYNFKSAAPDNVIYKNLFNIIHTLLERRKRRRKNNSKKPASKLQPGVSGNTGFATTDDKLVDKIKTLNDTNLLENLKKEQLQLENKKRDNKVTPEEILVLNHKIDTLSN